MTRQYTIDNHTLIVGNKADVAIFESHKVGVANKIPPSARDK